MSEIQTYTGDIFRVGSNNYYNFGLARVKANKGDKVYNPYKRTYVLVNGKAYKEYMLDRLYKIAQTPVFGLTKSCTRLHITYSTGIAKRMSTLEFLNHIKRNNFKYRIYDIDPGFYNRVLECVRKRSGTYESGVEVEKQQLLALPPVPVNKSVSFSLPNSSVLALPAPDSWNSDVLPEPRNSDVFALPDSQDSISQEDSDLALPAPDSDTSLDVSDRESYDISMPPYKPNDELDYESILRNAGVCSQKDVSRYRFINNPYKFANSKEKERQLKLVEEASEMVLVTPDMVLDDCTPL